MNIFISKSGTDGQYYADAIDQLIGSISRGEIEPFVSESGINIGDDWYSTLLNKVNDCDIFICIIDKDFLESDWCKVELGMFYSRATSKSLFPLVVGDVELSPIFNRFQIRSYFDSDQNQKQDILDELNQLILPGSDTNYKLINRFLEKEIIHLKRKRFEDFNSDSEYFFKKSMLSSISILGEKSNVEDYKLEFYSEYWKYIYDEEVAKKLCKIGNALQQCKKISIEDDKDWKKIWSEMAQTQLDIFSHNLASFAARKIKILDTFHIKDFWLSQIMTRVYKSIWTTNLPGTNGLKIKKTFLDAQETAILKGVKITRVFVYNHDDKQDIRDLITVIGEQIKINVKICIIEKSEFDRCIDNAAYDIDTLDFMIIDEKYIYKTVLDGKTGNVKELEFSDDELEKRQLHSAKKQIENKWDVLFENNWRNKLEAILNQESLLNI